MYLNVEWLNKKHSSHLSIKKHASRAHMPAISGSVIHCVGALVFFALDLNEIFTRQPHTHTHTHTHTHAELVEHKQVLSPGGQQADVFICSGQSHRGRHCSALTRSERQRHLNHFNGSIIWSRRHTRKDYCDCICTAPVISVCTVASQGHVRL